MLKELLECQGLSGASPSFALRAFASSISSWSLDPVALSRDLDLCRLLQSNIETTYEVQTETGNLVCITINKLGSGEIHVCHLHM